MAILADARVRHCRRDYGRIGATATQHPTPRESRGGSAPETAPVRPPPPSSTRSRRSDMQRNRRAKETKVLTPLGAGSLGTRTARSSCGGPATTPPGVPLPQPASAARPSHGCTRSFLPRRPAHPPTRPTLNFLYKVYENIWTTEQYCARFAACAVGRGHAACGVLDGAVRVRGVCLTTALSPRRGSVLVSN